MAKIGEALEAWINKKCRQWCDKVTRHGRHLAEGWIEVFGAETEVGSLTVADVERLEAKRDDGKRSGSALNQERTYLRGFFKWTRLNGWGPDPDPTVTWGYRRADVKREYAPLTREEEDRLVAAAPPWLKRFVPLAICTGLREGTIRQLTWGMLKDGVLQVPARLMKTRKDHRVPLNARALDALGQSGLAAELLIAEIPKDPARVYRIFKAAAAVAGVSPVASPHDLRRTFVARLTAAGVPLPTIMGLGGWKSYSTILKHYCSGVPLPEAQAVLDKI